MRSPECATTSISDGVRVARGRGRHSLTVMRQYRLDILMIQVIKVPVFKVVCVVDGVMVE
jgi:hypothetical protein